MTLEEARSPHCRLLKVISQRRVWHPETPDADSDIKGVFGQRLGKQK